MRTGHVALIGLGFALLATPIYAQTLVELFKRVSPTVVVLHTEGAVATPTGGRASQAGLGSGVLVDADMIMTAAHVVQTVDQVEAEFVNGERIFASVVASDPVSDLALLELERSPSGIEPARLGDSDRVEVGSDVFVVGAPLGLSHSVTVGHISARRSGGVADSWAESAEVFQTDAAINRGNSGGPMFDMQGQVVGIVSYILSQSGGFEGLGFAITSNTAQRVLFEERSVWTGLSGYIVAGPLAELLNLPQRAGFLVQEVARNSPAEQAGLRPSAIPIQVGDRRFLAGGDIILAVDDIAIGDTNFRERIVERMGVLQRGQRLTIKVLRAGRQLDLLYYRVE